MIKKLFIPVFAIALFSCNQRKEAEANTDLVYFDIKGYFEKEISRLQKLNPVVNKTVSVNGAVESKSSKIADWSKELTIFVNADINKTSWKGSFKTVKQNETEVYTSDSKKIPIKKISVTQHGQQVDKIEIIIDNKNILYQSQDTLTYCPDSLYSIKKQQKIRLLKDKKYSVIVKLK
jgi:2-hydroxy-3-keto-5-methylthiopentenyl-1-phosphate phosphatase